MEKLAKTNRKEKTNKGITLIALVITIIILLILAGISIASLTGENGILSKANKAKLKTTEAEIKEKIELLLAEYQLEKVEQANLSLLVYFEQKKMEGKVDTVEDNQDGTIKVSLDGYTVTIDIKTLTIIDIEISNDIKFSYKLLSYQNNKFKILITVEEKTNGLQSIEYPNGDIQTCNGEKLVEIEYDIDEGLNFIFTAKNTNGIEKKEIINLTKPSPPTSPTINLSYPTLTLTGIESPKVEISYDNREDFLNYYSLDNGETWNLYTGSISSNTTVIKAKSVHKKCQDIFEESVVTINRPVDSITENAFDHNFESSDYFYSRKNPDTTDVYCYFYVDESTWEHDLYVTWNADSHSYGGVLIVEYYDSDGNKMYQSSISGMKANEFESRYIKIPNGSRKIRLYSGFANLALSISEIGIDYPTPPIIIAKYDEATVNKTALDYPILTSNGIVNCSINPELGTKIKLEISNNKKESLENYYSLDGGNSWNLYTNAVETTYKGEGLIQTKSINKYYKIESEVNILKNYTKDLTITPKANNAIDNEAFDENEETASSITGFLKLMYIDNDAIDKQIKVKYKSYGQSTVHLASYSQVLLGTPTRRIWYSY